MSPRPLPPQLPPPEPQQASRAPFRHCAALSARQLPGSNASLSPCPSGPQPPSTVSVTHNALLRRKLLANSNRLQDILLEETKVGRTGNEILATVLERMRAEGLNGTMYTHPIGDHGHGAGPLIGLWDYQTGVPGRGDPPVIPGMWFSTELQVTTPVPEWDGQQVRMAQEEEAEVTLDGEIRWMLRRQTELHLVR